MLNLHSSVVPTCWNRTKFKVAHKHTIDEYCTIKLLNQTTEMTVRRTRQRSFLYTKVMEPKRPRNKTAIVIFMVLLVFTALGFYYVTAITNSDNRPAEVERES